MGEDEIEGERFVVEDDSISVEEFEVEGTEDDDDAIEEDSKGREQICREEDQVSEDNDDGGNYQSADCAGREITPSFDYDWLILGNLILIRDHFAAVDYLRAIRELVDFFDL